MNNKGNQKMAENKNVTALPAATVTTTGNRTAVRTPRFKVSTGGLTRGVTTIEDTKSANAKPKMPTVYYTPEVFQQMQYIVDKCQLEVGWMGLVKNPAPGIYLIYKIFVPEQEVTGVETDIDSDAMADLTMELLDDGHDTSELYAWYHSHVNMGVSPSTQDETQVAEFLEHCEVFIRGIVNKKGDSKVDVYYPTHNIAYTNVPTQVFYPALDAEETKHLDELLAANVRKVTYAPVYNRQNNWHQNPGKHQSQQHHNPVKTLAPGGPTTGSTLDDYEDDEPWGKTFGRGNSVHEEVLSALDSGTGYAEDWDEKTPLSQRPIGWYADPDYLEYGEQHDLHA